MTTTQKPNLAQFLADAPARGFSVVQTSPTTWDLVDAYGDGSTDQVVQLFHADGVDQFVAGFPCSNCGDVVPAVRVENDLATCDDCDLRNPCNDRHEIRTGA